MRSLAPVSRSWGLFLSRWAPPHVEGACKSDATKSVDQYAPRKRRFAADGRSAGCQRRSVCGRIVCPTRPWSADANHSGRESFDRISLANGQGGQREPFDSRHRGSGLFARRRRKCPTRGRTRDSPLEHRGAARRQSAHQVRLSAAMGGNRSAPDGCGDRNNGAVNRAVLLTRHPKTFTRGLPVV